MKETKLMHELLCDNDLLKNQVKDLEDTMWALNSQHIEYHNLHTVKFEKLQTQLYMIIVIIIMRIVYGLAF